VASLISFFLSFSFLLRRDCNDDRLFSAKLQALPWPLLLNSAVPLFFLPLPEMRVHPSVVSRLLLFFGARSPLFYLLDQASPPNRDEDCLSLFFFLSLGFIPFKTRSKEIFSLFLPLLMALNLESPFFLRWIRKHPFPFSSLPSTCQARDKN